MKEKLIKILNKATAKRPMTAMAIAEKLTTEKQKVTDRKVREMINELRKERLAEDASFDFPVNAGTGYWMTSDRNELIEYREFTKRYAASRLKNKKLARLAYEKLEKRNQQKIPVTC